MNRESKFPKSFNCPHCAILQHYVAAAKYSRIAGKQIGSFVFVNFNHGPENSANQILCGPGQGGHMDKCGTFINRTEASVKVIEALAHEL